ncbi:unnamed protein product [Durusdinium trenchii]|uniref:Uncharacterized protein n=1 Tax=Durusdinium trenchii TaxID=1381693 RepID=A0ABP0K7F9_9DINO
MEFLRRAQARHIKQIQDLILEVVLIMIWLALSEDLKAWLAKYLSIPLRVCVPLDWDHVWTEVFNGDRWVPLDQNCLHFARRLHEGIGAWTHVLAIGTPGSGDVLEATEEVTEAYLRHAEGSAEEAR